MRILLIHNFYQDPGGEDVVFEQERQYLSEDHEVATITFQNQKGWKGAMQFLLTPYNIKAGARIKKVIRNFKPDIIHIHNFHYAIGPICIRIGHQKGIPIVLTLHNYRLICPSAILYHDGELLLDSIHESFPWTAVTKGVHSHSFIKTFWIATSNWVHRKFGTFKMVDRYIVLTSFAKDVFKISSVGIPEEKLVIKPNFVSPVTRNIKTKRSDHFLFVGRLTEEKGIPTLLAAFNDRDWTLRIAGDGPLKEVVLNAVSKNPNISYLGVLDQHQVLSEMSTCNALIFPSVWYEGMPMTIIQALSTGTPIISSRLGAMEAMIQDQHNGLLFQPNKEKDLQAKIIFWRSLDEDKKQKIEEYNVHEYNKHYSPMVNRRMLIAIYDSIVK